MFSLAAVPVVSPTPSATVVGVVGSGVTIGVMIDSAYPELTANQIVWYRAEDLATPLTAATSKYEFNNNMRSLYIYPVSYEDEGDYIININHVTGNQTVTIHVNVQGKLTGNCVQVVLFVCHPAPPLTLPTSPPPPPPSLSLQLLP